MVGTPIRRASLTRAGKGVHIPLQKSIRASLQLLEAKLGGQTTSCWRWRGHHGPSASSWLHHGAIPGLFLRQDTRRLEEQFVSASSASCRFPCAAGGVCWQSLGVEPGAGESWLGAALENSQSLQVHAGGGATRELCHPATLPSLRGVPCTRGGSQTG